MPHKAKCGHDPAATTYDHSTGVAAHVAIWLAPGVDVFGAWTAFTGAAVPANVHVEKIHVTLGEIDMIADVHCAWTTPPGDETRRIGDWVNSIRQLPAGAGQTKYIARTSTLVCMTPDI